MNPQTKYKLIVISLLSSFIAIGFGLYFLNKVASDVRGSKIKIAEINRDVDLLEKITKEEKQYEVDIQKVKSTLPSEYYEVSFFTTQLERLAQNNNLALNININKDKKKEKDSYESVTYSLEINGKYSSVSDFLSQMSKLPYHTSVDRLEIESGEGGPVTEVIFRLFVEK